MKTKLSLLLGVLTLLVVIAAPAPAQADEVRLVIEGEEVNVGAPLSISEAVQEYYSIGGIWECYPTGHFQGEVGEPLTGAAVINNFSGEMPKCELNSGSQKLPFSVTEEATGPLELYSDHTGEVPIHMVQYWREWTCEYNGTLLLKWSENGEISVEGNLEGNCGALGVIGHMPGLTREGETPVQIISPWY